MNVYCSNSFIEEYQKLIKKNVTIDVVEVARVDADAQLVSENIFLLNRPL